MNCPRMRARDAQVHVTLRNNVKQRKMWIDSDASAVIGELILKSLDEDQKRIINFIAEHKPINVLQAARLLRAT